MKVLDLFSGIGGFSLGLEAAGMETVAFCEIMPFPQKVLNKWWPSIPVWTDINLLNFCLKKVLTSFAVASPAKIYQSREGVRDLPASVVDSGGRCYEPFAWYDHVTQSWRTWQCCFIEGWELYSEGWPKAGMTRNGIAYRLLTSELNTNEKESGYLPTPVASQGGGQQIGFSKCQDSSFPFQNGEKERMANTNGERELQSQGSKQDQRGRVSDCGVKNVPDTASVRSQRSWQSIFGGCRKEIREGKADKSESECIGGIWSIEPDVGRVANGVPMRVDRLTGLGNAVVPQIPELIGRQINANK